MNYRMILRLICYILRVEAVCLLPSLGISFFKGETGAVIGTAATIVISALLSLVSFLLPPADKQIGAREGFLSVALCWVAVSLVGALPFCLSGAVPNYIDCLFETVSGFTTTGASVLTDI